jgi:hypothetical protein
LLGTYLALAAWVKNVDCVVLQRAQLLPYLGLERMKNARIEWLKKDIKKLFPYANNLIELNTKIYASLYLTRVDFPADIFGYAISDEQRIDRMAEKGFKAAEVSIPNETEIVATLATAIHGARVFSVD